jgi:hypothetical protein
MSDLNLYLKISSLPSTMKAEIIDYMEFITTRKIKVKTHFGKHPKAGCMKGTFVIHPDFDEPIADFKEYME